MTAANAITGYCEYSTHLSDEDTSLLRQLHDYRLNQDQADQLITDLCVEFGLTRPTVLYTARTDRGHYWQWRYRKIDGSYRLVEHELVIRPTVISTHVLVHELAHHWVHTKMVGKPDATHGRDFATRLMKLARSAYARLFILQEIA